MTFKNIFKKNTKIFYLYIILFISLADQISKAVIFKFKPEIHITNFIKIVFVENTGAGFGILKNNSLILGFLNILIFIIIIYMIYYKKINSKYFLPLSLIAGGALGNGIDRIFLQKVIDFISISIWPVFNLADCFIVIGFAFIFYLGFIKNEPLEIS